MTLNGNILAFKYSHYIIIVNKKLLEIGTVQIWRHLHSYQERRYLQDWKIWWAFHKQTVNNSRTVGEITILHKYIIIEYARIWFVQV